MSTAAISDRVSHLRELLGPAVLLRWSSGSKGDRRKWKHLRLTDMTDAYLAKLETGCNVGVALGNVSNGLVTIDLDADEYVDRFLEANPSLKNTLRTRASRGCNIWLRCSGSYPPSCKLKDLSAKEIGEWRADGCQTIVSGMHPDGVPYRFVVEKPVITVSYNQIIWPPGSLVLPDATESKRVRGVKGIGEKEVVVVAAVEGNGAVAVGGDGAVASARASDSRQIQAFLGYKDLISHIAPTGCHQNNNSLFKLARVVKSYEKAVGRLATKRELELAFERWALVARRFWRPELTRDDYYAEFLDAYGYAQIGLDENPLEVAVSRARTMLLPQVPGFQDERIRLLVATCRELQAITGANPFFLPTRRLGEILGAHWTQVARWLRVLEVLGIIRLAPGEVRKRGGNRSPRYHYVPTAPVAQVLSATLALPESQATLVTDSQSGEERAGPVGD